jgi:Protein of unknown function (DUF2442)
MRNRWSGSHPCRSMESMPDLVHVAAVEVPGDHRLHLSFDDRSKGEIEFTSVDWQGVFEPLHDVAYFAQVVLDEELGTIVWPNGADIAPETLHSWATKGRDRKPA